jgi:hypothetical protein
VGDLFQPWHIIILLVLFTVVISVIRALKGGGRLGSILVLRKFEVNPDPSAEVHLVIVGRAKGLGGLLLTLLRISPESSLMVRKTDLTMDRSGLLGREHILIPLNKVQGSKSGYHRPVFAFAIACIFILTFLCIILVEANSNERIGSGEPANSIVILGIAAIALAVFFYKRTLQITIGSGHFTTGMRFKRSILENVTVDLDQLIHASDVLDHTILAAQRAPHADIPVTTAATISCNHCGNANLPGTKFCENCGTTL